MLVGTTGNQFEDWTLRVQEFRADMAPYPRGRLVLSSLTVIIPTAATMYDSRCPFFFTINNPLLNRTKPIGRVAGLMAEAS